MADRVSVKVNGIDELKRALAALPSKLRRKVLVKALRAGAKVVQKAARAAVPVLASPAAYRTRGLLKRKRSQTAPKLRVEAVRQPGGAMLLVVHEEEK